MRLEARSASIGPRMSDPRPRKPRVLAVEDDPNIGLLIREQLEFEGFEVTLLASALQGLEVACSEPIDLILLDVMLPDGNGFELCGELRRRGLTTPVIMLTARAQPVDRVRGLDLGADDYLTKPFDLQELLARVRAVLRRARSESKDGPLRVRLLSLESSRRRVTKGDREVPLTKTEFDILRLLFSRPGDVISRDEFLDHIWGEETYITHRTIDTHVTSLRRKVEDDPSHPEYILTVRGVGYRLGA